ncbi:MAG: hypothetical protein FGF52_06655 [Candidatus Brockarchaeota archaeon]|nr:hypothetical protein [Candidatus Brockarchaeota archaeon]
MEYKIESGRGIVGIKGSMVSAEPEYNYGIEIKNERGEVISGAILWKLELGSNKELWVVMAIDIDGSKWLSKVEYVSHPHWYLVKDVRQFKETFVDLNGKQVDAEILKIYYDDSRGYLNTHCMYLDPSTGRFKDEFISVKSPEYGLVESKLLSAIEGVSTPAELKTTMIIDMKGEFEEAFAYAKSLLDSSARGYAAYGLTEKLLLRNYYQHFGYDPNKPLLKTAGENIPKEGPFDMMQVDKNKITLAIEEKSRWSYERDISKILREMNSKLREAKGEFKKHAEEAGDAGWIVPEKGYAIVIYITPEKIFIKWEEVKPGEG